MRRTLFSTLLLSLAALAVATPAFAANGDANAFDVGAMALLAAGLAIGVSTGLCGLGQGRAVAAACEGTARNPGAGKQIFTLIIVGLALIESLAIYALVISFFIYTKVPELAF
jgi:F-type H+-transporting ATPase subunit c